MAGGDRTANAWEVKEQDSHWVTVRTGDGFREATVKWDGCVNLYFADALANQDDIHDPNNDVTYRHLCDLDEEIAFLEGLRAAGRAKFGPAWPKEIYDS